MEYDADEVRAAFRRAIVEVGPTLTKRRFIRITGISETTVARHFDTGTGLRAAEGHEPS